MKIVTSSTELADGCAFVPTMGALHAGHASLFKIAREKSDFVVASIFVNPLQFEDSDDLAKYPSTPERDVEIAAGAGVTHLWLPKYEEIYPEVFSRLTAGPLGDIYEGANRAGHFDGVVTVVAKLFELVRPKIAIFGEKDFQQLSLIRKMVSDLNIDIEIVGAPIIRESDGLAMSSRNVRLDQSAREQAQVLFRALNTARQSKDVESAESALQSVAKSQIGFELDYAEIIDENDFSKAVDVTQNKRAIIAGWLNGVRLIDNMEMKLGATR
ncbi:MAG: pantoate--beta-alanine ligase [Actinobacteria bacterium]|uniref:pantoate--beta-alanine ligase (AMP-forming) n=1 Tax=freshwater metagenome TaxID=449393 RepID=A0A6J6CU81_9ZZZZ|nr:pantoate--beta-alanine ligase [Actinomycetota bacterium]MTA91430.1 pantoate--beta-alanine ligase [Actinomycetota bacterium]